LTHLDTSHPTIPAARGEELPLTWLTDLREPAPAVRLGAIERLERLGVVAAPAMVPLLEDSDVEVRIAAARALGEIGDESSIGPLAAALGRVAAPPVVSMSPKEVTGVIASGLFGLIVLRIVASEATTLGSWAGAWLTWVGSTLRTAAFPLAIVFVAFAFSNRGRKKDGSRFAEAISEALERIALRYPAPGLRSALPALHEVQEDLIFHTSAARRAAGRTIDAIKESTNRTGDTRDLPLAAGEAVPSELQLPVAVEIAPSASDALPIASTQGGTRRDV
jgi:hypothetical protein